MYVYSNLSFLELCVSYSAKYKARDDLCWHKFVSDARRLSWLSVLTELHNK